jgi:hypothetical protein
MVYRLEYSMTYTRKNVYKFYTLYTFFILIFVSARINIMH